MPYMYHKSFHPDISQNDVVFDLEIISADPGKETYLN
jgi:hypothetical protein